MTRVAVILAVTVVIGCAGRNVDLAGEGEGEGDGGEGEGEGEGGDDAGEGEGEGDAECFTDADCAAGEVCADFDCSRRCEPPADVGDVCLDFDLDVCSSISHACAPGLHCVYEAGPLATCRLPGGAGADCDFDIDSSLPLDGDGCADGFVCSFSSGCATSGANGTPCSLDAQCDSGKCGLSFVGDWLQLCVPQDCATNEDCPAGEVCVIEMSCGATCRPPQVVDGACLTFTDSGPSCLAATHDCAPGLECSNVVAQLGDYSAMVACTPVGDVGAPCSAWPAPEDGCIDGLVCDASRECATPP